MSPDGASATGTDAKTHGQALASVLRQHLVEMFYLSLQGGAWQPKENDAGVGKALVEDQLAKMGSSAPLYRS
jgi:hypothetical protein